MTNQSLTEKSLFRLGIVLSHIINVQVGKILSPSPRLLLHSRTSAHRRIGKNQIQHVLRTAHTLFYYTEANYFTVKKHKPP